MNYLYVGKIVNTHGIKGELRILSDFEYLNKVFIPNFKIYLGKEKQEETIISYRKHKQFHMIMLNNYHNINEVLKYKGVNVYINKDDLELNNKEMLDSDLFGFKIIINNKVLGNITNIEKHNINKIFVVNNDDIEYLIPYNLDIIESINLEKKEIIIKDIKGLIE